MMRSVTLVVVLLTLAAAMPAMAAPCPSDDVAFQQQAVDPLANYCTRLRQMAYAKQVCARRGQDYGAADECQYVAESLVEGLNDCAQMGGPYARACAKMITKAQRLLGAASSNPVLTGERQRRAQAQADFSACAAAVQVQCSASCGGDPGCTTACTGGSLGQC